MSRSSIFYADYRPSFDEWLSDKDGMTCQELYEMFQAAYMKYGEYDRAMELLRREYRAEMDDRDALLASNPFVNDEKH